MRTLLAIVILIGATAYFFFGDKEEGNDLTHRTIFAQESAPREPAAPREEEPAPAPRSDAIALEANESGHVRVFLGKRGEENSEEAQPAKLHVVGQLLDPHGEKVDGLAIAHASRTDSDSPHDADESLSDSKGAFTLDAESNFVDLWCQDSRWTMLLGTIEPAGRNLWRCTLVVAPTTPCVGTVVDSSGRHLEGVRVRVRGKVELPRVRNLKSHEIQRHGESDGQGRFNLGSVPLVAPTTLEFGLDGYRNTSIELQPGDGTELQITLHKAS